MKDKKLEVLEKILKEQKIISSLIKSLYVFAGITIVCEFLGISWWIGWVIYMIIWVWLASKKESVSK